ncbi:hypothetical protein ACFL2J_05230 [Candidatus Omnitrophota bacterium]
MATTLETLEKRALRGVIRGIDPIDGTMALISAEIDEDYAPVATEIPVEEVQKLNLRIGDAVDVIPIGSDTCLLIGKPKV